MSQVKAAYDTIIAMRNNASKNDKIALLEAQKNNTFLKEYLRLMYEPRVNFYMKKVDPSFASNPLPAVRCLTMCDSLLVVLKGSICTRKISGFDARNLVADMYVGFANDYERELLALLINRDAKAGFGGSTINKVWKDLVTDVPYMRCCLPKDSKMAQWIVGAYSQLKCDGMFANVTHKEDGTVTIASRSGSPFPNDKFQELEVEVIQKIPRNGQLHGELLMYKDNKVLERQDSNGQFNKILQGGDARPGCKIVFVAWDLIPATEAKAKNKYRVPYSTRFETLQEMLDNAGGTDPLQLVETRKVNSMAEAMAHYKEMLEAGFEGTVVKNPNMIWEDTTSKHQVKMKLEVQVELRVTGFNPGNGKNEELFGSLQCVSEDGLLECGATGFSDELRKELFEDKDNILNAIVTVTSNNLMKPSKVGGKYSLFLPRFEEVRRDKKVADSLQRVVEQFDNAVAEV